MSPETYWKRRVVVLAGVLVVVALIAWGCQASSSGDGDQQMSADPGSEGEAEDSPSPSVSPSDGEGDPDGEASGGEGGGGGSSGGGGDSAPDIPEPRQAEDPCRPQDVVVTLEADAEEYSSGEEPEFTLTVVNIGEQTCTVDVGPANMEIRLLSGDDRIFSTADCVDNGSRNEQLEQGRPVRTTVTWDRMRSWSDCRDEERSAGAGTYQAELHSDYDEGAETQVFRLR